MEGPDPAAHQDRATNPWAALEALSARVKAVLVLGYLVTSAVAVLLPLAWGSTWAYQHVVWVAAPASLLWFGLAGRYAPAIEERWPRKRIAGTRELVARPPQTAQGAAERVRRAARGYGIWRVVTLVVLVILVGGAVRWAVGTILRDDEVVRQGARASARVVAVDRSFPSRHGEPVDVTVELDGRRVDLAGGLPEVEVGDAVTVAVDPADPRRVFAVEAASTTSPQQAWLVGLLAGALAIVLAARVWLPRRAAWALSRAGTVTAVDVVVVEDGTLRLSSAAGDLVWVGRDWPRPVRAARCWAVGDLCEGAWVALVRGRTVEWAARRLAPAGPVGGSRSQR